MDLRSKLSPHFRLRELVRTSHRTIDNRPDDSIIARLGILCNEFLEPVRARFGPLWVTSGYRCDELNRKIRGSRWSAHLFGCAADFVPLHAGITTTEIVEWVVGHSDLGYDQVIDEHSSTADWVHLGMIRPGFEDCPRREALTMRLGKTMPFEGSDND
jgi:hypothetical protein